MATDNAFIELEQAYSTSSQQLNEISLCVADCYRLRLQHLSNLFQMPSIDFSKRHPANNGYTSVVLMVIFCVVDAPVTPVP